MRSTTPMSLLIATAAIACLLVGCAASGEQLADESESVADGTVRATGQSENPHFEAVPTIDSPSQIAGVLGARQAIVEGEAPPLDAASKALVSSVWTEPGELPVMQILGEDGKPYPLPLKHTHVSLAVSGAVARAEVTQTYQNPFSYPIETIYTFPLPENAAVDDMRIVIGERVIEAEIKRRNEAREAYERARDEGHTAALLEQERPNIFTQSVANIAPGEDIQVVVRYVQDLSYDAGWYEVVFPMVVGPRFMPGEALGGKSSGSGTHPDTTIVRDASRISPPIVGEGLRTGHDISLDVLVEAGFPVREFVVPTHEVAAEVRDDGLLELSLAEKASLPNRDFVLRYRVAGEEPRAAVVAHEDARGGFFSLMVQPPELDIESLVGAREIIFVVDVSGSMSGRPLAMGQDAMRLALRGLRPNDTFNVISFSGRETLLFDTPRPANDSNLQEATRFIDGMAAGGGTMMTSAIQAALAPETQGRNRYVVFVTDGYVGNEAQILTQTELFVDEIARQGKTGRVFGLGVGSSVNHMLIDGLGKHGNGLSFVVTNREDPADAVNRIMQLIDHPVITDVTVDWGTLAVDEVYPQRLPDLFASHPLVVHGRFAKGGGRGTIVVRGKVEGGGSIELPVEVDWTNLASSPAQDAGVLVPSSVQPTLWARARIDELERALWFGEAGADEAITTTGLEFRLVTAYTSFVAVDRSRVVGDGVPTTIVQPVDAPEGVELSMVKPKDSPAREHKAVRAPVMVRNAEPDVVETVRHAVVIGGLSAAVAEAQFTADWSRIEPLLARATGPVSITIRVDAEGRVTSVTVTGLDDDATADLEKLVRAWTFRATGEVSTIRRVLRQ